MLSSKIETEDDVMNNDITPLIRNELDRILKNAKSKSGNKSMEAIHNADIVSRIKKVLSID